MFVARNVRGTKTGKGEKSLTATKRKGNRSGTRIESWIVPNIEKTGRSSRHLAESAPTMRRTNLSSSLRAKKALNSARAAPRGFQESAAKSIRLRKKEKELKTQGGRMHNGLAKCGRGSVTFHKNKKVSKQNRSRMCFKDMQGIQNSVGVVSQRNRCQVGKGWAHTAGRE